MATRGGLQMLQTLIEHTDEGRWSTSLTQYRVHEQHLPATDVGGKLCIENFGFLSLLVALDQNLPNANRPTAVPQTLLHGFTYTYI